MDMCTDTMVGQRPRSAVRLSMPESPAYLYQLRVVPLAQIIM